MFNFIYSCISLSRLKVLECFGILLLFIIIKIKVQLIRMSSLTHQELLDNYQVVRVLGQGSFGKVFLVRHKQTKIQVAMKKYSKYHILKNGKDKSLIRSSRILQALQHKNIINFLYYAINDEDDQIFLIFEACKKGSLEEIKEKIFSIKQMSLVKQIMYQLAQGLSYLKSVSVAHRDIKPSNISFNSDGELKIIDFDEAICFKQFQGLSSKEEGFSKDLMEQTSSMKIYSRRSRATSFVGTEMYMSPEMRNLTRTDERGDVWAYGCILYQLVSGRSLMTQYQEDDQIDITLSRLQEQLINYNLQYEDVQYVLDLLKNILQENPDKRLPIQQIMKHHFFKDYQNSEIRNKYSVKLKKFLRGNYNLSDPRNVRDALKMDLIGMKSVQQKFLELNQYPIMILFEKKAVEQEKGWMKRVRQLLKKINQLTVYKICLIFGGGKYFKCRSTINQNDKFYILYDEIDGIKITNKQIIIEGSNRQKWNKKSEMSKQQYNWRYRIKTIVDDQVELGNIYDNLLYILND